MIIIILIIAISNSGINGTNPAEQKNPPTISKSEFESLQNGMTYKEVVEIIGGEGSLSSQVDLAGYKTAIYIWEGEGTIGANANVTFQNDILVGKAQAGLK